MFQRIKHFFVDRKQLAVLIQNQADNLKRYKEALDESYVVLNRISIDNSGKRCQRMANEAIEMIDKAYPYAEKVNK